MNYTNFKPPQKEFYYIDSKQWYRKHSLSYGPHWHNDIEIVLMTKGESAAFVDSTKYVIGENCMFIVFPGQMHSYADISSDTQEYSVFIFPSSFIQNFEENFQGLVPENPLLENVSDHKLLFAILSALQNLDEGRKTEQLDVVHGLLFALFAEILSIIPFTPDKKSDSDMSRRIVEYCSLHYKENITLESMSKALGVSAPHLSSLFVKKLDMNFVSYLQSLRVSEAMLLLTQTDEPIQSIAKSVGFSCTRSFDRAFMNIEGISPSKYRKINKPRGKK